MSNELQQTYDLYAAAALKAMIVKLPFIDRDGEFSGPETQEQIDVIKNDIARAAHGYAWFMMKNRQEFIDALNHTT